MYPNLGIGAIGHKATLVESIDFAQLYGFRGIDFSIAEVQSLVEAQGLDSVRELFEAKQVMPGVMGFPVEFRRDEATWREGIAALPAQAHLAAALGCTRTATWLTPGSNDRTLAENFNFHIERLAPAAAILADYGIALGLEFIGPKTLRQNFTHRFLYTLEGMLALATAIGPSNVGLLLDIWHLYTSHGTVDMVRELRPEEVVVVHINDAPAAIDVDEQIDQVRLLPGESGVLDIAGFIAALNEIDYDGPVTVEPFSQRVRAMSVADAVAATAQAVNQVWPEAGLRV